MYCLQYVAAISQNISFAFDFGTCAEVWGVVSGVASFEVGPYKHQQTEGEEDTTGDVPVQRWAWEGDGLAELVLLNRTGQTQVVARTASSPRGTVQGFGGLPQRIKSFLLAETCHPSWTN